MKIFTKRTKYNNTHTVRPAGGFRRGNPATGPKLFPQLFREKSQQTARVFYIEIFSVSKNVIYRFTEQIITI